jgi:two-component system OmpR family response regulator
MAKIVLAEDDETMARLLSTLLRMEGYEVVSLGGDADVVAAIERTVPDVLLLDMLFSAQNGLEVLDRVRQTAVGENLYVIMLSGLSVETECRLHGADDFLLKPFGPEDLTSRLRSHLERTA